jgi:hypothetical protein
MFFGVEQTGHSPPATTTHHQLGVEREMLVVRGATDLDDAANARNWCIPLALAREFEVHSITVNFGEPFCQVTISHPCVIYVHPRHCRDDIVHGDARWLLVGLSDLLHPPSK